MPLLVDNSYRFDASTSSNGDNLLIIPVAADVPAVADPPRSGCSLQVVPDLRSDAS